MLGFGVKVGSFNPSYDVEVDLVSFNGQAYDFEPETPCTTVCYADAVNGDDSFGGSTLTSAKKTIQAAINAVSPAGSVFVNDGTYNESPTSTKSLTLQSINGRGLTNIQLQTGPTYLGALTRRWQQRHRGRVHDHRPRRNSPARSPLQTFWSTPA